MAVIYDEVLGREETMHGKIGPKIGKEIKLQEITPDIPIEEAMKELVETRLKEGGEKNA